ncbi:MAG: helix-turn-helix domain-containing protein, partial [Pseudomonadales bacterium]
MASSQIGKHPQLAKKLKLLYNLRVNPEIKSNADLARRLGVSRQAISKWCQGSETSMGDAIPLEQLSRLEQEFGIDCDWFGLHFDEFEPRIRQRLEEEKLIANQRPEKISNLFSPIINSELCGREPELLRLDEAWASKRANVIQIIGFGGVGKSSLVHHWLTSLDRDNYRGANHVYLWSFYWQGT